MAPRSPNGTKSDPWYTLPEGDSAIPERVFADLVYLRSKWGSRLEKWEYAERLIGTSEKPSTFRKRGITYDGSRLEYSVIRSVRDAMRARLGTRKTKVRAFTSGARYTVRERARLLTKQVKGIFQRADVYIKNHQIFNDVLDYGVGYGKPFEIDGRIRIDRMHPRTVVMDEPEYGNPSTWYNFLDVPKRALIAANEEFESEIMRSSRMDLDLGSAIEKDEEDCVTVCEAWHCPQDADGRHVIVIPDCALSDDDWKSALPGIVPARFFEPSAGFVGHSLPDLIGDIQHQVYYLLERIQDQMDIGGTLKLLVDASAGVDCEILSNDLIQVIKHNGQKGIPAQIISIPPIDPVYFQQLDRLEAKAYSLVGLSELWAQSEKPPGIDSGRGLREMDDITSTRFLDISQVEDDWYLNLGRACISLASSVPGFSVPINGEIVSWKDIELSEEDYDLTIAPVSVLPDSAPGKIQQILDDAQLDAQLAADQLVLLDSLDHESYVRQLIAPKLACEKYLDEIFYDHHDRGLDSRLDLEYLDAKAVLAWNQAFLKDDSRAMDMIEELQKNIKETLGQMAPPPGPEMAGPGSEMGGGMPPGMDPGLPAPDLSAPGIGAPAALPGTGPQGGPI